MAKQKQVPHVQDPKITSKLYLTREGLKYYTHQLSDVSHDTKLEEVHKDTVIGIFERLTVLVADLGELLPKTK